MVNSLKVVAHNTMLQANGAKGSSIIFSLIETAKEHKLNPYRYLTHVLELSPHLTRTILLRPSG